ncbi:unnamed protein product [Peronospora destructor]|uniref:Uncharacterized protein n=1 Tax=Peronospora destructor TaxID=86335 RepID=A0AAV0V209_9STRA|nr:unnamed protein product [Peronospora destructor]
MPQFDAYRNKMQAAGLSTEAILAFQYPYEALVSGETGMIAEDSIKPFDNLPMGLDKAKSPLTVKGDDTFLDIMAMCDGAYVTPTSPYYPELIEDETLELLQNKVPKVDASTMEPATYSPNPSKEWCPPGSR